MTIEKPFQRVQAPVLRRSNLSQIHRKLINVQCLDGSNKGTITLCASQVDSIQTRDVDPMLGQRWTNIGIASRAWWDVVSMITHFLEGDVTLSNFGPTKRKYLTNETKSKIGSQCNWLSIRTTKKRGALVNTLAGHFWICCNKIFYRCPVLGCCERERYNNPICCWRVPL